MTSISAAGELLPERVQSAADARIAAGMYQTLLFAVVDGEQSEIIGFGKLDKTATLFTKSARSRRRLSPRSEMVLRGHVTLDAPVAQLVPEFSIPSRGGKQISLQELATHHSGLPRLPTNFFPADATNPYADYDLAKLRSFLAAYALPRDPGASYEYSNLGFGLLGFALAIPEHISYTGLLDRGIFTPLGMTMSSLGLTEIMRPHLARGHDDGAKPAKNWDFDALAGAGAIRSTGNDMLRYLRANMGSAPPATDDLDAVDRAALERCIPAARAIAPIYDRAIAFKLREDGWTEAAMYACAIAQTFSLDMMPWQ